MAKTPSLSLPLRVLSGRHFSQEMLLTVAIVTRNRAVQVIESLRAVAPQLAPHDDLLVVDDGSDDGSTTALSEWIGEHLPAARLVATAYRGVSEARNTALAEARGGTVCFTSLYFASSTTPTIVVSSLLR